MSAISQPIASTDWISGYSLKIPKVSFGPFHILEAAPWLLLATILRIAGFGKPVALLYTPLAMVCTILAFLLAFRRTIELSGGQTGLGKLAFRDQIQFAKTTLKWWFCVTLALILIFSIPFGYKNVAPVFLVSLDGIAFDVVRDYAKLVAPAVAIMMFFAALAAANDLKPDLKAVVTGVAHHLPAMAVAYVLLAGFLFGFAPIQAEIRSIVREIYSAGEPSQLKNWIFIGFVFCFACLRLWISLFILTAVFKWSCANTRSAGKPSKEFEDRRNRYIR